MFSSLQIRRAFCSIATIGLLISTASAVETTKSSFDDLRQSPFKSEQAAASDGKLVDLTKPLADDEVKLTEGADFFDTGLVANNGRLLGPVRSQRLRFPRFHFAGQQPALLRRSADADRTSPALRQSMDPGQQSGVSRR